MLALLDNVTGSRRCRASLRRSRESLGLGDLSSAFATVIGSAITAGGTVGAAAITADAAKFSVKTQEKSALLQALSVERQNLAAIQGQTDVARIQSQTASTGISAGALALALLAAFAWSKS